MQNSRFFVNWFDNWLRLVFVLRLFEQPLIVQLILYKFDKVFGSCASAALPILYISFRNVEVFRKRFLCHSCGFPQLLYTAHNMILSAGAATLPRLFLVLLDVLQPCDDVHYHSNTSSEKKNGADFAVCCDCYDQQRGRSEKECDTFLHLDKYRPFCYNITEKSPRRGEDFRPPVCSLEDFCKRCNQCGDCDYCFDYQLKLVFK